MRGVSKQGLSPFSPLEVGFCDLPNRFLLAAVVVTLVDGSGNALPHRGSPCDFMRALGSTSRAVPIGARDT